MVIDWKYVKPGDARWCYACQREAEILRTGYFVTSLCTFCGMGRNYFVADRWQVDLESFNANPKSIEVEEEGHGMGENVEILHERMLSQVDLLRSVDITRSFIEVKVMEWERTSKYCMKECCRR